VANVARHGLISALVVLGVIALAVGAAASSHMSGDAVRAIWARSDALTIGVAFVLMTAGLVFLALRWRAMMSPREGIALWPLTGVFVAGSLLHYGLPGPLGEMAAAGLAARRFRISAEMAFAAGLHARFIGLAMAGAVSGVLFLTTDMPVPPELRRWVGLATAAIAFGAVGLGVLSAFPEVLRRLSAATIGRVPLLRRVHPTVERLADALGLLGRLGPARYAWGALWALCGHAAVIFGIAIAASGLGAHPDPAGLAFTYAASTAGAIVLFAFPGSQMGWDAMFASLLVGTAGVAAPDAIAITVLVRVQQLFTVLLGGVALVRVAAVRRDDSGPLIS
jgi:hypothetical protein